MVTLYPIKYVFVKDGSTFRCDRSNLDGTTTALSSNSDALTVWNAAKTDAASNPAHFHLRDSTYDFASPGATIAPAAGKHTVTGESINGTIIKPVGNFPGLKIIDTQGNVVLDNFRIFVDQGAGYTANALEIAANGLSRSHYDIGMLSIEHAIAGVRQQFGSSFAVVLTGASPAISWITARHVYSSGFNNAIYIDSSTATGAPWTNENAFHRFNAIHAFNFLKANQNATHASYAWEFNQCSWQTTNVDGTTGHMFDVDDAGLHLWWSANQCFAWDFANNTHKLLKVNANTQFSLSHCTPTYNGHLATGSGWKNGALINVLDATSEKAGRATFSATGNQTDFAITPGGYFLDITDCDIIVTPNSTDAIGPFAVKDSPTSSTFTVTYKRPPRAGTNNVILTYYVRRRTMQ